MLTFQYCLVSLCTGHTNLGLVTACPVRNKSSLISIPKRDAQEVACSMGSKTLYHLHPLGAICPHNLNFNQTTLWAPPSILAAQSLRNFYTLWNAHKSKIPWSYHLLTIYATLIFSHASSPNINFIFNHYNHFLLSTPLSLSHFIMPDTQIPFWVKSHQLAILAFVSWYTGLFHLTQWTLNLSSNSAPTERVYSQLNILESTEKVNLRSGQYTKTWAKAAGSKMAHTLLKGVSWSKSLLFGSCKLCFYQWVPCSLSLKGIY